MSTIDTMLHLPADLPADLLAGYDEVAEKMHRTREALMQEARTDYLAWERDRLARIQESIAAVERGEVSTQETEEAEMGAWLRVRGMRPGSYAPARGGG